MDLVRAAYISIVLLCPTLVMAQNQPSPNGPPWLTTNGGTGTRITFTPGSIVFAGTNGIYTQNNANLFWDNVNLNLGIGTAAPLNPIHVVVSGRNVNGFLADVYQTSTQGPGFIGRKARGTLAAPLRVKSGDDIGIYNARGAFAPDDVSTATIANTNSGRFHFVAAEDFTSTNQGSFFDLQTTSKGSTISASRVKVDETGWAFTVPISPGSFVFANIATVLTVNGQMGFCSDCTIANPCAGGGNGAIAKLLNGINVCN